MNMSRLLAVLVLGSLIGPCIHAQEECLPNPIFGPFRGEDPTDSYCTHASFGVVELWRWEDPENENGEVEFSVEGETFQVFTYLDASAGPLPSTPEVVRNFENVILAAGGTVIPSPSSKVVTYHVFRGEKEYWGESGCGAGNEERCEQIYHHIVRVAEMEQSVVLSAEQIDAFMGDTGKVIFYGIYFATDSADLQEMSRPTLDEMARWLEDSSGANVYIVGHTDMQGSLEHNISLSRERAAAVVGALVNDYGISAGRLVAEGVGPLAPAATNADDNGRSRNRRVEMVLR